MKTKPPRGTPRNAFFRGHSRLSLSLSLPRLLRFLTKTGYCEKPFARLYNPALPTAARCATANRIGRRFMPIPAKQRQFGVSALAGNRKRRGTRCAGATLPPIPGSDVRALKLHQLSSTIPIRWGTAASAAISDLRGNRGTVHDMTVKLSRDSLWRLLSRNAAASKGARAEG
jgi:hypothetical protein